MNKDPVLTEMVGNFAEAVKRSVEAQDPVIAEAFRKLEEKDPAAYRVLMFDLMVDLSTRKTDQREHGEGKPAYVPA